MQCDVRSLPDEVHAVFCSPLQRIIVPLRSDAAVDHNGMVSTEKTGPLLNAVQKVEKARIHLDGVAAVSHVPQQVAQSDVISPIHLSGHEERYVVFLTG